MNTHRQPGLSFVIRARNEADALFYNLARLWRIKVPYEVILVLHRCTDLSQEVADAWIAQGVPMTVIHDETPISRAGYETLITPADHPNSLPSFYNRAFKPAQYNWILKWDADFLITDYFLDFIQTGLALDEPRAISYQLACSLGDDVVCHEDYMYNSLLGFDKYFCWETTRQVEPRESIRMDKICMYSGSPKIVKDYWHEEPWFLQPETYDADLAQKYHKLVELVGPEPPGFARSNNPDFAPHWNLLMAHMYDLREYGIYPDK
jgi:hypothetical protein